MEYTTKEVVQKCLDDLSRENLIGNENDTFISLAEAKDRIEELPTADVVSKKEIANVLCDLKIAVHNKAHYNHAQEVPSYITLKVFDAVIRDYLNKLEKG